MENFINLKNQLILKQGFLGTQLCGIGITKESDVDEIYKRSLFATICGSYIGSVIRNSDDVFIEIYEAVGKDFENDVVTIEVKGIARYISKEHRESNIEPIAYDMYYSCDVKFKVNKNSWEMMSHRDVDGCAFADFLKHFNNRQNVCDNNNETVSFWDDVKATIDSKVIVGKVHSYNSNNNDFEIIYIDASGDIKCAYVKQENVKKI